jgi:transposase-like protein
MKPADIVISRFGGVRPLARLLGKDPSTIHRWKQPADKGGLDGRVPSSAQTKLLELAREKGVTLTPAELVLGSSCLPNGQESSDPDESLKRGTAA